MYTRHAATKRQKKLIKKLAATRRVLLYLTGEINDALWGGDTPLLFDPFPYLKRPALEDRIYIKEAQARRAIYALRKRKFLEVRRIGDRVMYFLTEKGKTEALKEKVRLAEKRQDGKVILVSFDIPEQEKSVRAKLRYLLKDLDFEYVQNSLWSCPRDIGSMLSFHMKEIGANKWVRIFVADEV